MHSGIAFLRDEQISVNGTQTLPPPFLQPGQRGEPLQGGLAAALVALPHIICCPCGGAKPGVLPAASSELASAIGATPRDGGGGAFGEPVHLAALSRQEGLRVLLLQGLEALRVPRCVTRTAWPLASSAPCVRWKSRGAER